MRKFLSLALIIGLLQTFSWTYQIVEAPIAVAAQTFNPANAGNVTIPSGVDTITVEVVGGGGGTGGQDCGNGCSNPAPGARGSVSGSFKVTAGMVLGIYPGNAGSNGVSGSSSGGGSGGTATFNSNLFNGGRGGDAGSQGGSGGGGGGGAASIFLIDNQYKLVAGGSGAGGGNGNVADSGKVGYNTDANLNSVSPTSLGGDGLKTTSGVTAGSGKSCTVDTNDGGGGGGGGGGWVGGRGGLLVNAGTGECAGDGGYRGQNYIYSGASLSAFSTTNGTNTSSNTSNGYINLTYLLNTPTGLTYSSGYKTLSMSWTRTNAPSNYDIKLYNTSNNLLATKRVDSSTSSTQITSSDYPELANGTSYKISITAIGNGNLTTTSTESTLYTLTTSASAGSTSDTDTAISFSGLGSQHLYASSNTYNSIPDTFTAEAWIYPTSYGCTGGNTSPWETNDAYCHVFGKGNQFSLILASSTTSGANGESSGHLGYIWNGNPKYSKIKIPLNEWNHVAFSREGSSALSTKLYINGNLIYQDTSTANTADATRDFTVGASRAEGTSTNEVFGKFRGQIDEVKLAKRFRTQSEIQSDMITHNNTDSNFLLYYDFNENSGDYVYNRITGAVSSTDLTIKSSPTIFDSSKIYTIDTTTSSAYTTIQFFRTYLVNANGWRSPSDINSVRYLVVAGGGGGGGGYNGGGGGAGGYRESSTSILASTVYKIEVGAGGLGASYKFANTSGNKSVIQRVSLATDSITATGGGKGATEQQASGGPNAGTSPDGSPESGGSGGGGTHGATNSGVGGGSGNIGGYAIVEGYAGGIGNSPSSTPCCFALAGGGGGGAGGAGANASDNGINGAPGAGGVGRTTYITGSALNLAGGGGGAGRFGDMNSPLVRGSSASFGGGAGAQNTTAEQNATFAGVNGSTNTGGGGGGGASTNTGEAPGGNGGSGFIVIKYITNKPVITKQPTSDTTTVGAVETFTVSTSEAPSPLTKSVKWQYSADTTTAVEANVTGWTDVASGTGYTTDTFTTSTLTTAMNKYRFRAIVTFSDTTSVTSSETSTSAVLTLNSGITITADSSTITRKYGAAQTIRTITYSGGTTSSGSPGTSTSHAVTTPNRQLAGGKIWVDTTTSTAYFKVDTGTPVGSYTETVTVTDYYGVSASYVQRVVVNPADTLTVQADTLTAITYNPAGMTINPTVTITGLVASDTATSTTIKYSAPGSNCANGGTCSTGDTGPGGGKVFYVSGNTYYEAAPKTWYSSITYNGSTYNNSNTVYCANGSNSKIDPNNPPNNTSSTGWGGGKTNTDAFKDYCAMGAIGLIKSYAGGGKTDWYIPNATEMSGLVTYWSNISGLLAQFETTTSVSFWTSDASYDATWGWLLTQPYFNGSGTWFTAGAAFNHQGGKILPIRSFTVDGSVQPALIATETKPTNAGTYTITPSALVLANNVDTSNYVSVIYRTSTFTINKARQDTLTVSSVLGIYETGTATMKITTLGGTDTGTVTYAIVSGGGASGCSVSSNVLTVTSAGTCKLTATKAATLNYLIAYSDTATVTFTRFVSRPIQVQLYPTMIPLNGGNSLETTTATVPSVTSVTTTGAGALTIAGSGFTGVNLVSIGGTSVTISSSTATSINVTGAAGLTGPLIIECSDGRMGPVPFWLIL